MHKNQKKKLGQAALLLTILNVSPDSHYPEELCERTQMSDSDGLDIKPIFPCQLPPTKSVVGREMPDYFLHNRRLSCLVWKGNSGQYVDPIPLDSIQSCIMSLAVESEAVFHYCPYNLWLHLETTSFLLEDHYHYLLGAPKKERRKREGQAPLLTTIHITSALGWRRYPPA